MFKKLVPVVALALLAGPVFAVAQAPASTPSAEQPAKHHKGHKNHSSKSSKSKKAATDAANTPAK
jgi:Spy/CpxP family protein refolding chaperone